MKKLLAWLLSLPAVQGTLARVRAFWAKHGQKSLATLLGSLALVDLTPYANDFQQLIGGHKWHALFRLLGAVGIFWRAVQAAK